jgi:hypothetical protein
MKDSVCLQCLSFVPSQNRNYDRLADDISVFVDGLKNIIDIVESLSFQRSLDMAQQPKLAMHHILNHNRSRDPQETSLAHILGNGLFLWTYLERIAKY